MIIIDFSQLVISYLIESNINSETELRHLIINAIREIVVKHKKKYGPEIVLACDSRKYWRREIFPYYKAHRKKNREDSKIDWETIFKNMNIIKEELLIYSPYKMVEVELCEADDIIATLVMAAPYQKVLIVSSDKDFVQLHVFPNVIQYSTIQKKFVKVANPKAYLKEHIIRGDRGDGIPNILSPDDIFVTGGRQKSIMQVKLDKWLIEDYKTSFEGDTLNRYERNKSLIDFQMIPKEYQDKILDTYKNKTVCSKSDFFNYMIQKRLKKIISCIGDF